LPRIREERALADVVFAPSDYVIECLIENGVAAEKILKIPYGVDHVRFSPTLGLQENGKVFRVVFAGSIRPAKGVRYLLEAWRGLRLKNAELVLVGQPDDDGRKILREFRGHYCWPGAVPKHGVDQWLRTSDVCVLPSLSDAWGLVVTEAMACGVPVVVTSSTGAPVRDGIDGFVVPPRSVTALQESIRFLYENPDTRRTMGLRGREHIAKSYTWGHYRARVAKAYNEILSDLANGGGSKGR
jgi:glycosyltransferase involved in cell wall biosynthesis